MCKQTNYPYSNDVKTPTQPTVPKVGFDRKITLHTHSMSSYSFNFDQTGSDFFGPYLTIQA